ncbi:MAG: hypothetical protein QXN71_00595 [Candidatus Aenigmatarchaeota archaeon]
MYTFISKLLVSRKLNFEEGRISLLGEDICLVPISFIYQLTRDDLSKKEINDLYFESWVAGFFIMGKMIEGYGLKKFEERYRLAMDTVSMMGFGDYKTLEFYQGFAKFAVIKNPLSLKFYPGKVPIDHFLRGANAGGGTLVHEMLINCVEIDCAAINGNSCLFINSTNDLLFDKYKKFAESQLDLKYLTQRQIDVIKNSKYKDWVKL